MSHRGPDAICNCNVSVQAEALASQQRSVEGLFWQTLSVTAS